MHQLTRSYGFLPLLNSCRLHTRLHSLQRHIPKTVTCQHRHKTTKASSATEEIDLDEPIKFSTSRAAKWKAQETYGGSNIPGGERPWYQPYVVTFSLIIFLVYFCVIREENDMDSKLNKTLYDHIEGLEERQLENILKYNPEAVKDTEAVKQRLEELQEMKAGTTSPAVPTK